MSFNNEEIQNDLKDWLLSEKDKFTGIPSSFVKTRIFAHLDQKLVEGVHNKQHWYQRPFVIFAEGFALALVLSILSVFLMKGTQMNYQAYVDQAYSINLDLERLEKSQVAFIQIELPQDVEFFSQSKGEEVTKAKKLMIPLAGFEMFKSLPIVLKGKKAGEHIVNIEFLNRSQERINMKALNIEFVNWEVRKIDFEGKRRLL